MYNFYKQLLWQPPRSIAKLLLIMKLTTLILITIILQVSATTRAQKITLSTSKAPLAQVFEQIRKQSGYDFLITTPMLNDARSVSISVRNVDLKDVLDQIFKDQPMQYTIDGMNVVVTPKDEPSLYEWFKKYLAEITVRGRVVDESGQPLIGATVVIKGTKRAAVTDQYGLFEFKDVDESAFLQISFIGFASQELKVTTNMGDIQLKMASSQLEEVITKGYYRTSKKLNTGNVGSIKASDIAKQPLTDPVAAIMGRISGVQITPSSGIPGRNYTIQIRGRNSIANGITPLFIVDGVPVNSVPLSSTFQVGTAGNPSPINDIDLNAVESIEVLKDADATAIYGSRGANGVILITTKKGKAGKTEGGFNFYTGVSNISRKLDLLNTQEYLDMRRKAFSNDGKQPSATDYDLNGTWDQNRYTDWQDVLIGHTASMIDLQGFLTGGNSSTQFRLGGGLHREGTVFAGENSSRKLNTQLAISHRSENQRFKANINTSYVNNQTKLPGSDPLASIYLIPNAPAIYDSNGNLNWENSTWQNPFAVMLQRTTENTNNLLGSANLSYEIMPGLHLKGNLGFNRQQLDQLTVVPFSSFNPAQVTDVNVQALRRSNTTGTNVINNWIIEPQLSYQRNVWKGKLDMLIGATFQERKGIQNVISATGFANDQMIENIAAGSFKEVYMDQKTQYRYNALYSRIGYTLADRYILNITGRRDGSSRFGPGRKFGNFGSIGAAWIFSEEQFLKKGMPWLSFAKLRGSIGITGNDQLQDYAYLDSYSAYPGNYQGLNGLQPTRLTNPLYSWEKVNKLEAGLETGFLKDRILFSVSFYRNRTGNQLVGYNLPYSTGFSSIQANLPAVIENKGIEFELNTINIQQADFSWNIGINLSIPRNKLISFPNIEGSSYANFYFIGMPLSTTSLYYQYERFDPETNIYRFRDFNGDGAISSTADRIPLIKGLDFFGGLNNSIKFKNWQLDALMSFCKQDGTNIYLRSLPGLFSATGNQVKETIERFDDSKFSTTRGTPFQSSYSLLSNSTESITDASYIRLKNIALSYSFSPKLLKGLSLQSGRIYVQCQNLFTLTRFKGQDPETVKTTASTSIPALRTISAGLQFSF